MQLLKRASLTFFFVALVTVAASGKFVFAEEVTGTLTAGNATNNATTTNNSVVTNEIDPANITNGTIGVGYNQAITASTTSSGPFVWSLVSGALPTGVNLDTSATGTVTTISGIPTANAGVYDFTVQATDGVSTTVTRAYELVTF